MPTIIPDSSNNDFSLPTLKDHLEENKDVDNIFVPVEKILISEKCFCFYTESFVCFVWKNSSKGKTVKAYLAKVDNKKIPTVNMLFVYIDRTAYDLWMMAEEEELQVTYKPSETSTGKKLYVLGT